MKLFRVRLRLCGSIGVAVMVAAVVALLMLGASVPHLHLSVDGGLFNQEHDLALLVATSSQAPSPVALPVIAIDVLPGEGVVVAPVARLVARPGRLPDSRAPPLA